MERTRVLIATRAHAVAYHNWGRWVADCPNTACRNAEDIAGSVFHCSCRAAGACAHDGACRTVAPIDWPDDVDEINRLLALRTSPANRNWLPGESVDDLRTENIEHDVEI